GLGAQDRNPLARIPIARNSPEGGHLTGARPERRWALVPPRRSAGLHRAWCARAESARADSDARNSPEGGHLTGARPERQWALVPPRRSAGVDWALGAA